MGHFARVNAYGIVENVIVAEQEIIDTFPDKTSWIQTSYNTRSGIHYNPETGDPSEDQSKALRKNYAGVGYFYDPNRDAFIPPKPYDSWLLDENSCQWYAPIEYPNDGGYYEWNEELNSWTIISS